MSCGVPGIEDAGCLFLFGYNPNTSHPLVARRMVKAKEKHPFALLFMSRNPMTISNSIRDWDSRKFTSSSRFDIRELLSG